jgi:hypothetical protein
MREGRERHLVGGGDSGCRYSLSRLVVCAVPVRENPVISIAVQVGGVPEGLAY